MDIHEIISKRTEDPVISLKFSDFRLMCPKHSVVTEDGVWNHGCHDNRVVPKGDSWVMCEYDICPLAKNPAIPFFY